MWKAERQRGRKTILRRNVLYERKKEGRKRGHCREEIMKRKQMKT